MSCDCITVETTSEVVSIETTTLDEVIQVGVVGPQGPTGPTGGAGVGVPTGGITGYVLAKASTADYDTEWIVQTPIVFGTGAGQVTEGNDSRIVNILKSGTTAGAFSGGAGGTIDLSGGNADSTFGVGGAAGSINLSGGDALDDGDDGHAGTIGGSIDLSGGSGGAGGSITLRGSQDTDGPNANGAAGSIDLSGGSADTGAGGSIISTGSNAGGGTLNMSAVGGESGGSINTSGGGSINTSGSGGSINTSNLGGSINTTADSTGIEPSQIKTGSDDGNTAQLQNGGYIDTRGSDEAGGNIDTSGGSGSNAVGGSINTSGNSAAGGSINTSDGGGSINTRGTGSIELGVSLTRTTLTGTATEDRAISLPDASGTLGFNPSATDYEVTDSTKGIILKSPNNTRWRITIDNNGSLLRTSLALLVSAFLMCGAQAQVRDLVYDTNNVVIGPTNTNALTFTNRVSLPISSGAATTNSTLQADGAGGSAFVASRTVTRFTTNNQTKTNWGFPNLTQATNNDPQIGSFSIDANSVYRVDFVVAFRAASNASFRCGVAFATNLADISQRAGFFQAANTTITAINAGTNATVMGIQSTDPANNTNHTLAGLFYIYSGTNANSMTFRWYPANTTNVACNLLSNTMMSVTKISP